jgi:sec-independent protein translocase protein TatA
MGPIGIPELIIVLVILLVIFGPKRLPGLGRSLGSGMREFKESITGDGKDDETADDDGRRALEAAPGPVVAPPVATTAPATTVPAAAPADRPSEAPVSEPRA